MTTSRFLSVTMSSTSFDADEHFLVFENPTTHAAIAAYAARCDETSDGHVSFDVVYPPSEFEVVYLNDRDFLEFVAANCSDDGEGAELIDRWLNAEPGDTSLVCVRVSHAGEPDDFLCELRPGRDADEHADAVLAAWLAHSGKKAELTPEEDDSDDWSVASVEFLGSQVVVRAERYRGDGAEFLYTPPEA